MMKEQKIIYISFNARKHGDFDKFKIIKWLEKRYNMKWISSEITQYHSDFFVKDLVMWKIKLK